MQLGDLVHKECGNDDDRLGIVLSIQTNSRGNTIIGVLSGGLIRKWYSLYVAILNESG